MNNQLLKDVFGWGFVLWMIGYVLGILLFAVVPPQFIGWIVMPVGILITLWVLVKKIKYTGFFLIALAWTFMAILFDYLFIVKAFHPKDGYYKLDVYVYYALTFAMPLFVGRWKKMQ